MPCRLSQKSHVNIPLETGKPVHVHTRDKTFITSCKNELIKFGNTICFEKWQVDELQRIFDNSLVCERIDGLYFVETGGDKQ